MTWLSSDDVKCLDTVFMPAEELYKNRKNNLRQRHLGFYFTELKSVTHLCKSIDGFDHGAKLPSQYINTLRNLGLVNQDEEITEKGQKLLRVVRSNPDFVHKIRFEDGYTIDRIEEEHPEMLFRIELLLYSFVAGDRPAVQFYEGRPPSMVENIQNFFALMEDSLRNTSKKTEYEQLLMDVSKYFSLDNPTNWWLIQVMNYSGQEILRFLKLTSGDKGIFWETLKRVLETCPEDSSSLKDNELHFFEMFHPYVSGKIQRDVRHRVRYAIYSHIIYCSSERKNSKLRIQKSADKSLYSFLPFEKVCEIIDKYDLLEVLSYSLLKRGSRYFHSEVKYWSLNEPGLFDCVNLSVTTNKRDLSESNINKGDKVILVGHGELLADTTMSVERIALSGNDAVINLAIQNPLDTQKVTEDLRRRNE